MNPLRVFSVGFGWIWRWFNGIIRLLFIWSYWGWSMSKFTIPPSSFIQFLDWVLFLNILHILARVVRVPSGNQTCPWEIFQNMQVGEGKLGTSKLMDPHVFQWCFPWQPQPTGACHRSPCCPLGALRGQGKRLAAAAPFWGHRAAVAEPQWPHADGGGSGGCQGAAMPICWPNVVRKSLGNVGDLIEREWDFVGI